jgi:hypothetical protein
MVYANEELVFVRVRFVVVMDDASEELSDVTLESNVVTLSAMDDELFVTALLVVVIDDARDELLLVMDV